MNKNASPTVDSFVEEQIALGKKPNHLINEKSPYLLQHAFNPVNWYPWGDQAFDLAKKENKLIFLSIGYSTCHWCHVMKKECFQDTSIAETMNRLFVCIKVDREERPDLDRLYMSAAQAITGSGGWPLSVFLLPDLKPFYAGTYFPPKRRFGIPGFDEVMLAVWEKWKADPESLLHAADQLTDIIKESLSSPVEDTGLELTPTKLAFLQYQEIFDHSCGGFGVSPKFPQPMILFFLLRYYHQNRDSSAIEMVVTSLDKMADGGIYDHLAGGFHRYSVDQKWLLPHFEKMLYDQALIAINYLEAFQVVKRKKYALIARNILDYVLDEMTDPKGGFYSAEDADSPLPNEPAKTSEGAFYLWRTEQLYQILDKDEYELACFYYGVNENGNVKEDPHKLFSNRNILFKAHTIEETAQKFSISSSRAEKKLTYIQRKLKQARTKRPRPNLDDKIITSWNGLMISAFVKAGSILGEKRYLEAGQKALSFIIDNLYHFKSKELFRSFRKDTVNNPGLLEDYAFIIQALLDTYEACGKTYWLKTALELAKNQLDIFEDKEDGGFFETSGQDSSVLVRAKETFESATPSGNSISALNYLRMAQLTDNSKWHDIGEKTLLAFMPILKKNPTSLPQMLIALYFHEIPAKQIVITGSVEHPKTARLVETVQQKYLPDKVLILTDGLEGNGILSNKLDFLQDVDSRSVSSRAFVCQNYTCKLPVEDPEALAKQLEET